MMKKLLAIVLGILFIAWAWETDLLVEWLWVASAGVAMTGIIYFGAVIGSESLDIEGSKTGVRLYWSSLGMMLIGFISLATIAIYWSNSNDLFSLALSASSWLIYLILLSFGFVIFHDRKVTKQKLGKR